MAFLIFTLVLIFAQAVSASNSIFGPRQVTGLLGGSVTVKCFYPHTTVNRHSRKYWCKESTRQCSTIVSSNGYVDRQYNGRVSLTDFPDNSIFLIEISKLEKRDMGMYKCGVGLNDRGLSFRVKLDVSEDSVMPEEAQLFYVEHGGSVTMTCDFGEQYQSYRKYLCKMTKTDCLTVIDTYGNVNSSYKGRVLLSYLNTPGSYNIIMTQLQKTDSGLYLCGAGHYGAEGESKKLDLHVYEGPSVPKGQFVVKGTQGGSVTVECPYDPKGNNTLKYWCKWRNHGCAELINNLGYVLDSHEGRIAMYDNPENGTFTIILNQLKEEDAGYYWCMTNGIQERTLTTELKIVQGQPTLAVQKEIQVIAGSPLTLTCSYPCAYEKYEKYWCKWKNMGCKSVMLPQQTQTGLVVKCDKGSRILSLNFDQVTPADQGWYWCGVRNEEHYGETAAVYLQVQAGAPSFNEEPRSDDNPIIVPKDRGAPLDEARKSVGDENAVESAGENKNSTVLVSTLVPLGIVFLLLVAFGFAMKFRLFRHSDLVSVGSYRTNISMTDFENAKQYGAKDNVCMDEAQETQIGKTDEYVITSGSPKDGGKSKKTKRGSKEEMEMAYTTFLINSENAQDATRNSQEE